MSAFGESPFSKVSAFHPDWHERLPTLEGVEPVLEDDRDNRHLATYDKRHYAAIPLGELEEHIASLRDLAASAPRNREAEWADEVADGLERYLRG